MEALPDGWEFVGRLRKLWDENRPSDALNHEWMRDAGKAFVKVVGRATRPELAVQALSFGAELEREHARALVSRATWPCHDHPPWDASAAELFALSQEADRMMAGADSGAS